MSGIRRPAWARFRVKYSDGFYQMNRLLSSLRLNTVCVDAHCPNIYLCWGRRTATFMILGNVCTRNCGFCSVDHGDPAGLVDWEEPKRVAEAVKRLGLKYVVITSVDRDDLPDGGAGIYAATIKEIRRKVGNVFIEVLTPDFDGDPKAIKTVVEAGPDVFAHNLETVERLTPLVRDRRAGYKKSLMVLKLAKEYGVRVTKSGIMVGLGEKFEEVVSTLKDLREVGVDVVTIGQYMQPSRNHLPVVEYIHPKIFSEYRKIGISMGFKYVFSGPRVRSSFLSEEYLSRFLGGSNG